MQTQVPQSTSDQVASLRCKLAVFAACLREWNPESTKAKVLETEATASLDKTLLARLRRWSKEVDTWVREMLEPAEQEHVAQQMKQSGVLKAHLPKIWSVATARRILARGVIRDQAELSVVRVTLDTEGHGHLSSEELAQLGHLFDAFTLVGLDLAPREGPRTDA
jgi:hypothetical protein